MKKQKEDMIRVFNLSGGATSALMTILGKPTERDIVLFTDTKWESPATYKFLDDFEKYEGIKVHRAAFTHKRSPGMEGFPALLNYKTYLPNRAKRLCTDELKVKTAKRYLRKLGIQHFYNLIGFRSDEKHRVDREKTDRFRKVINQYPLYDMGVTKEMVDQYWLTKPYKLEIPRILGNCDLCFLKGKNAIITILQHHPELAEKWIAAEQNSHGKGHKGATFIKDITYQEMLNIANNQKTLFDIDLATPAFNCSCSNQ